MVKKQENNILHTELMGHGFVAIGGMKPILIRIHKITYVLEMKEEYFNIPLLHVKYGDGIDIFKIELSRPIGTSALEYIHTDKYATTHTYGIVHRTRIKDNFSKKAFDPIPLVVNNSPKFRFKGFKKGDIVKIYINKYLKYEYDSSKAE